MAITSIVRDLLSNYIVRVTAENTLAEVAAANYMADQEETITSLNHGAWDWQVGDMVLVAASDGDQFFEFDGDDFTTLIQLPGGNGEVTLPVVANDFVVFDGTLGALKDLGFSASDPAKSKVVMAGSAVVVNNIAHFIDTAGTIDDTAAAVTNMGNIYAGASATAGVLRSYPAAATTGYLGLTGVANAADHAVQIANVSHGQATIHSIPDPANAASRFLIAATATPFTSGNFPVASGTGGLMVDSGLAAANIQNKANIKAATTANIGGAGAGPISVVVAGATAASVVVATVEASSNPVSVIAATATATGFDITFSGDPGAACLVNYVLFIAAQ